MKIIHKLAIVTAVLLMQGTTLQAQVEISSVTLEQRSGTRLVDISYLLTEEPAIITLSIKVNDVELPESALRSVIGDVNKLVQPGTEPKTITWNAGAEWSATYTGTAQACITAWTLANPPPIMVVNVSEGTDADAYPVCYYTSLENIPFSSHQDPLYKSDYILFATVTNGTISTGTSSSLTTTISHNYYTAIYPVTQGQWYNIMGSVPPGVAISPTLGLAYRAVTHIDYNEVRGATNDIPAINWPHSGAQVSEGTFMHRLRSKTGVNGFDLPTEAQWERACRAGTSTLFNDGNPEASISGSYETLFNPWLAELGRYNKSSESDSIYVHPLGGAAVVGSYKPNAWGFYDMHGNVWELCLDWYAGSSSGYAGIDPVGPDFSAATIKRVLRGGGHSNTATYCTSFRRHSNNFLLRENHVGLRIVCNLIPVIPEI